MPTLAIARLLGDSFLLEPLFLPVNLFAARPWSAVDCHWSMFLVERPVLFVEGSVFEIEPAAELAQQPCSDFEWPAVDGGDETAVRLHSLTRLQIR